MIENPYPADWKQLQFGVCRLLSEIGLSSEVERKLQTPRGEIKIDVYAVDELSVDRIRYIVECKNWSKTVSQTVVHSFTTVMHETGGNIGFIISRKGFQAGAHKYLRNTNIVGLTYLQFQQRYFEQWWVKHFMPIIGAAADTLIQYVEPINSRRERHLKDLPLTRQAKIRKLQRKYEDFGMALAFMGFSPWAKRMASDVPIRVDSFTRELAKSSLSYSFSAIYFRDLADEIAKRALQITNEFHQAFGQNIFAQN